MEIVPIKAVIANYFIENSDKTKVSLKELSYFKSEIDKKFLKDRILAQVQYYRSDLVNLQMGCSNFDVEFTGFQNISLKDRKGLETMLGSIPYKIKKEFFKYFDEVNSTI